MIATNEGETIEATEETVVDQTLTEEPTATEETTEETSTDVELIFGKYKNMEAAQDAFKTLESENGRLRRERKPEAPEAYEFNFAEDEDLKDIYGEYDFKEDPLFQSLEPVFKDVNITNEQAQSIVAAFGKYQKSQMIDFDGEVSKLGDNGAEMLAEVENFVQKNYPLEEQDVIAQIATSAEGIKFIKSHLMDKAKNIPGDAGQTINATSAELFDKAMQLKRSSDNFHYNTKAQEQYEKIMDEAVKLQARGL